MTTEYRRARTLLALLRETTSIEVLRQRLAPDPSPAPPRIRNARRITQPFVDRRWAILTRHTNASADDQALLMDAATAGQMASYERNIENFAGTVKVPVGIAGPLRVNGTAAKGDYYLPLATTEAALVASYHRGSLLITDAGGCTAALLNEGLTRAPAFCFASLAEVGEFLLWATENLDTFRTIAEATTRHGRLIDMHVTVNGSDVFLGFEYATGDAAGQNMVTIATDAICQHIVANSPITPRFMIVESNFSGDKKATQLSYVSVRGKKVTAEVRLPRALVEERLHTTPDDIIACWRIGSLGAVMSGMIGIQGHYANGLAALYIATGQDAACVAESAIGVTRFELTETGDLYAAVTLPNLIVGTIGGGTKLPTQQACLRIANSDGSGRAQAFAEVAAALCLAGELSITGAMAAGHFARAHKRLARGRPGESAS
jgi:hydroxymethylglutaryl-CoA reductase (NADPH)